MPIFKDYNGNNIDFPLHTHNVSDTVGQRLVGSASYPDDISNFTYTNYLSGQMSGGYTEELLGTRNIKVFYLNELYSTSYGEISIELGSTIDINSKYILYLESINDANVLSFVNINNVKFSTIYPYNYTNDVEFTIKKINNIGEFGANPNLYEVSFSGTNAPRCIYLPLNLSPAGTLQTTNFLKASFRKIEYTTSEESTAFVTDTEDGFMTIIDKADLDNLYDQSSDMMSRLKNILFVRDPDKPIKLIDGATFNKALKDVGPNATTITFTKTAIPESKLSSAVLISDENNEGKAYMYLDGTTIYISPENDNDILTAAPISSGMFMGCSSLTSINFTNLDTSKIIMMDNMFSDCTLLSTIDLSTFKTDIVKDMSYMFSGCTSLTTITNIETLNTINVENMSRMFYNCSKLMNLDLSTWNILKVLNTSNMFNGCNALSGMITISNLSIINYQSMFYNCSTSPNSKFMVKYVDSQTKGFASTLVNTKASNSNVTIYNISLLVDGSTFRSNMMKLSALPTSVVFTTTPIPTDKISSAILVSKELLNTYMYLDGTTIYVSPEESNIEIMANPDCYNMFSNFTSLTSINLENFNTSNVTSMRDMFYNCSKLTNLDVSKFNTSNVTNMQDMFRSCKALTSLDVSNFNTYNLIAVEYMFRDCSVITSITGLQNLTMPKITSVSGLFMGCAKLTSIPLPSFKTSNITDASYMFSGCSSVTSLDLTKFNATYVTNMTNMFYNCSSVTTIDLTNINTINLTNSSLMFYGCAKLTSVPGLAGMDTSKISNYGSMFNGCTNLSGSIGIMSVSTRYSSMFTNCSTASTAKFVVNYVTEAKATAQSMVNTKSTSSKVSLGGQI